MKKIIKIIPVVIIVAIFSVYSCDNEEYLMSEALYIDLLASQLKVELVDDASITPYEAIFDVSPVYDLGHLPFATSTGSVDGLSDLLDDLDKSKSYLVYCHADAPSIAGAELLVENGFSNVYRLKGNYDAWDDASFVDIAADEAKTKIDASDFEVIFDVSPHYNEGHLPGAVNAIASTGGTDLSELMAGLDKNKSYLVYCHADSPSFAGAQLLEDAGFKNVYRLEGNFGAWVDAGYVVE